MSKVDMKDVEFLVGCALDLAADNLKVVEALAAYNAAVARAMADTLLVQMNTGNVTETLQAAQAVAEMFCVPNPLHEYRILDTTLAFARVIDGQPASVKGALHMLAERGWTPGRVLSAIRPDLMPGMKEIGRSADERAAIATLAMSSKKEALVRKLFDEVEQVDGFITPAAAQMLEDRKAEGRNDA